MPLTPAARPLDEAHEAALERLLLRACVLELGASQRQVVELRLFHGWAADEIAQHSGLSLHHVERVITEAVARTRHRSGEVYAWEVPALPVQTVAAVLGA